MIDASVDWGPGRGRPARRDLKGLGLNERRYRTYWTVAPDGLFTVQVRPDGEFRLEALNPAHERGTGLLTEDVAERPLDEFLPLDVAHSLAQHFADCVQAGRPIMFEEALNLPGGRRHWETSLTPMRDQSGRIAWLLGAARDITERDALRDALRESEARFRLLAEMAPDIIFSASPEGEIFYRNRRYYDYTGETPGSEPALLAELHPNDRRRFRRRWRAAQCTGQMEAEIRLRAADGGHRWFLLHAARLERAQDALWFGVAADIHEVKLAVEAQQSLNTQLENVLASISDCYYTLNHDWLITRMNPQAADWFGVAAGAVVGGDARDTILYPETLRRQIDQAMRSGHAVRGEHSAAYHPGRTIDATVYPSHDGVSVFFRDVTEEHRARSEVERAHGLLQATVDALSGQIAILNETGTVTAVNAAWRRFMAEREPDLADHGVGMKFQDHSGAARGREGGRIAAGIRSVLSGRAESFRYSYAFENGTARCFQVLLRRFEHAGGPHIVVAQEDITEATMAQRSLREAAERLLDLQEEERRRIAVELHDSTGQHLVALSLALARLQRLAPETEESAPVFGDIRTSLEEAQRELRVFSYLLHPPYLEQDGLAASLRRFLRGFALRSGLNVVQRISDRADAADMGVRRAAFRIIQEAISNVHRHAHAHGVVVEVRVDKRLRLKVSDDGRGFPGGELPAGVGVTGMRARVTQLGGDFSIASNPEGVTVRASLPLAAA